MGETWKLLLSEGWKCYLRDPIVQNLIREHAPGPPLAARAFGAPDLLTAPPHANKSNLATALVSKLLTRSPSTNVITKCCSSAAEISWSFLLSSSLEGTPWITLLSRTKFSSFSYFNMYVKTFSCSSEKDFMPALDQFGNLTFAISFSLSILQIVYKQQFERKIKSSISSLLRI